MAYRLLLNVVSRAASPAYGSITLSRAGKGFSRIAGAQSTRKNGLDIPVQRDSPLRAMTITIISGTSERVVYGKKPICIDDHRYVNIETRSFLSGIK
jgi:hypothetical protein